LNARTLRPLRTLPLDKVWLNVATGEQAAALSPDGKTVAFAYTVLKKDRSAGPAYLDRWVGTRLTRIPLGSKGVIDLRFVRNGTRLTTVTLDEIAVWDARTLHKLHSVRQPVPSKPFLGGSISPDGRTVAIGTSSGSVFFVDTDTGTERPAAPGHNAVVDMVTWSPDGRLLASVSDDRSVILWDPVTAEPLEKLEGHGGRVTGAAFDPSSDALYSASLDGAVFEWDVGRSRRFGSPFLSAAGLDESGVLTPQRPPLGISTDGSEFAVVSGTSRVEIWSTSALRRQKSIRLRPKVGQAVTTIAWSPVASLLAVGSYDGPLQLWDVRGSPRLVRRLVGLHSVNKQPEAIQAVVFSPTGEHVAAVDINRTPPGPNPQFGSMAVWRTDTGRLVVRPRRLPSAAHSIAFHPNGKSLAVGLDDDRVVIVDAETGRIRRTLHALGEPITTVTFAPDGTLATGAWSGIVQLWDPSTGRQLGHPVLVAASPVASLAFDPTGATFATTGGSDGVLKLWTRASLQQFGSDFPATAGTWGNALYTRDGTRIIVVFGNGRGFVWPARVAAWEDHACAVAGRNFTREEWSRFVAGHSYRPVCPQFAAGR
jgi:WD40 repeat protein